MKTMPHAATLALLALLSAPAALPAAEEPGPSARLDEALKAVEGFEYGKNAGPLELAERLVVEAAADPGKRLAMEQRLLRALAAARTRDARDFLCRQLRTLATARSVPVLEGMLADPELSHLARLALERIEDPTADDALLRALEKTSGKMQAGILSTLGRRRCGKALGNAARLLVSPDAAVARAAAAALGSLGSPDAVKALESARPVAREAIRLDMDDALLASAERFLARGEKGEAARIYEAFYGPDRPKHLRIGALRGLAAARGTDAVPRIVEAIRSSDPEVRASAIDLAGTLNGRDAARVFAGIVPSLPPDAQELLVRALSTGGYPESASAIALATKSEHEGVRAAAFEALGTIGDASHVDILLEAAAAGGGRVEEAARASLTRLRGGDANGAIARAVSSGEPRTRVAGIRALAARRASSAFGEIHRLAADDDASVRAEAIRALGALASESDLGALVALAVQPKATADRPAAEEAVAAAFGRVADPEKQAGGVLAALSGAPAEARPALLRLLGKAGTSGALRALLGALKDEDAAARDAAVRVLAGWRDAAPAEELLSLARSLPDATGKAVALEGYVRMAGLSKDPAAMYLRALELAEHPGDRKLVLAGLGGAGSIGALEIVERSLKDPDEQVRAAAGIAAVQIADRLRGGDAARARTALEGVLAGVKDPEVRKKAQEALGELEEFEGHILLWLISGPYREKDKNSRAIFDAALPPETPDANDVAWKRLRRGAGKWDINLETALDPLTHCAAYVRTRVFSPKEADARLELGSDDAVKAWLNGKLVHANYTNRGLAPRQDIVSVKLREGWNDILLKVVNHEGPWGFSCRVRGPDGGPLDGLKAEAR